MIAVAPGTRQRAISTITWPGDRELVEAERGDGQLADSVPQREPVEVRADPSRLTSGREPTPCRGQQRGGKVDRDNPGLREPSGERASGRASAASDVRDHGRAGHDDLRREIGDYFGGVASADAGAVQCAGAAG